MGTQAPSIATVRKYVKADSWGAELRMRVVAVTAKILGIPKQTLEHTLHSYYASLHQHQTTAPWQEQMLDFDGLKEVIGTAELMAAGKRYD